MGCVPTLADEHQLLIKTRQLLTEIHQLLITG